MDELGDYHTKYQNTFITRTGYLQHVSITYQLQQVSHVHYSWKDDFLINNQNTVGMRKGVSREFHFLNVYIRMDLDFTSSSHSFIKIRLKSSHTTFLRLTLSLSVTKKEQFGGLSMMWKLFRSQSLFPRRGQSKVGAVEDVLGTVRDLPTYLSKHKTDYAGPPPPF